MFVDFRWKMSRETYCTVMGWAGATCPPRQGIPPLNPAAAERAIAQAYTQAFTGGQNPAHVLAAVQDCPALADALAQATQNYPEAFATSGVTTGDVIFANPWNASIYYDTTYQGAPDIGEQIGKAVVVNGQWKVSRETYCGVLSLAGGTCPAP